jgi:hypothetical protein
MTIDGIARIGRRLLAEYKPRLKVHGIKKFQMGLTTPIGRPIECDLAGLQPDQAEFLIRAVLNELESKGDLVMSEPAITNTELSFPMRNIKDGDLRLSFRWSPDEKLLWIECSIYPFNEPVS